MPRTSMLESLLHSAATTRPAATGTLPPPVAGTALAAGASQLVEAATTEDALAQVSAMLGADARIVDARRVRRGGIGGFFAKELVQLHVAPADDASRTQVAARRSSMPDGSGADRARAAAPAARATTRAAAGAPRSDTERGSSPVDRLLADLDDAPDDVDFATFLRDQLAPEPEPEPEQEHVASVVTDAGATRLEPQPWTPPVLAGPVGEEAEGWSRDALLRLGLPADLVLHLVVDDPGDDLAWTAALTRALRPSCRPLPTGASVLVGPLAGALPQDQDVLLARSAAFLAAVRRDRWVHLVVGGEGWRDGLASGPSAVSWARPGDLPDAIRCAVELGLVLGCGPGADGRIGRAKPFDLALAVRDLVNGAGSDDGSEG